MARENEAVRFEQAALPYLGAAYNLARSLTRNDADAEDVVQEAYLRALRFFGKFRGGEIRPWLLAIVRHTCYTWIRRNRSAARNVDLPTEAISAAGPSPEAALLSDEKAGTLRRCMEALPVSFREVIVLRDVEGMSYRDIATAAGVPVGTVMSRLARGRDRLIECFQARFRVEAR